MELKIGDRVVLEDTAPNDELYNKPGRVIAPPYYSTYPIAVRFDDGTVFNCLYEHEVRLIDEPKRKDWTELTDRVDMLISAYDITDKGGYTGSVLRELRDALIEESYRD